MQQLLNAALCTGLPARHSDRNKVIDRDRFEPGRFQDLMPLILDILLIIRGTNVGQFFPIVFLLSCLTLFSPVKDIQIVAVLRSISRAIV